MLTNAPVLAVPRDDLECPFLVDTDVSAFGASGVLQQWQDGKLRVIENTSRVFNRAERNYCATRREMAEVIFALKQFRPYLLGRNFQIRVGNQALSFFQKLKNPTGQAARYLDFLADYDYDIIFFALALKTGMLMLMQLAEFNLVTLIMGSRVNNATKRVIGQTRR